MEAQPLLPSMFWDLLAHLRGLVMHRAENLGCHSSESSSFPQLTPFLPDLKSAPSAGPSPLSRIVHLLMSCLGTQVAIWAVMPLIITRQGTALSSVTLNYLFFLNPLCPKPQMGPQTLPSLVLGRIPCFACSDPF